VERREFFKLVGGTGLFVLIPVTFLGAQEPERIRPGSGAIPRT